MGLKILLEDLVGIGDKPKTKGNRFEEYVLKNIFPVERFERLRIFSDYDITGLRAIFKEPDKRSLYPDFYLRNISKNTSFFVECKYRSNMFRNKRGSLVCEISKGYQLERYREIQNRCKKNVLICIGLGGKSHKPDSVHLISAKNAFSQLYQSKLDLTIIEKYGKTIRKQN